MLSDMVLEFFPVACLLRHIVYYHKFCVLSIFFLNFFYKYSIFSLLCFLSLLIIILKRKSKNRNSFVELFLFISHLIQISLIFLYVQKFLSHSEIHNLVYLLQFPTYLPLFLHLKQQLQSLRFEALF